MSLKSQLVSLDPEPLSPHSQMATLYGELHREIDFILKIQPLGDNTNPVFLTTIERRILIRSIFSFIEAISYCMKALAANHESGKTRITPGERLLAKEVAYELSSQGDVIERSARLRTLSNVRFAFKIMAKAYDIDFELDASGREWQMLEHSLKVRDRLMHPKTGADLEVSDEEVRNAHFAFAWFERQWASLLLVTTEALEDRVRKAQNLCAPMPP